MSEPDAGRRLVGDRPARNRRLALLIVSAAVVVTLIVGAYVLFQSRPNQPGGGGPGQVATFSGDGDQVTDSFSVSAGWQIRWETTGQAFEFAIGGDRQFGTVVRRDGPGTGTTSPPGSGSFHLEIKAIGPWTIQVIQP